jgi:hypothetical protein
MPMLRERAASRPQRLSRTGVGNWRVRDLADGDRLNFTLLEGDVDMAQVRIIPPTDPEIVFGKLAPGSLFVSDGEVFLTFASYDPSGLNAVNLGSGEFAHFLLTHRVRRLPSSSIVELRNNT